MQNNNNNQQINTAPTILVVFGVTGDLSGKKIVPSLWRLFLQGLLPERFSVIGFSRQNLDDKAWGTLIRQAVEKRGGADIKEGEFSKFFNFFAYQKGDFSDTKAFQELDARIKETEKAWGVCANKLFYLAAPPSSYESIFKNLAAVKLNLPCGGNLGWTPLEAIKKTGVEDKQTPKHIQHTPLTGWSRVLVEKPFGTDLKSATELQKLLSLYFKEEQIYRIDHYLFKEIIQGIENFRFSNNLFEHTWDKTTIERIDIRLYETIGVEERGGFYDAIGALRDVGQNHLLMMLAAITTEYPVDLGAIAVRKNRSEILASLAPWTKDALGQDVFRAQYNGYLDIDGVRKNSDTETYFALKTKLTHPRWKGIPIYMEAGKRLGEARKEIVLTLKHPSVCLLCQTGAHAPNRIVFRLEPNDEIVIHFWMKKPGFERSTEERTFSFFFYEKQTKVQYVEEYAKVLYAAMEGNLSMFVAHTEVEALWKFTDPIENIWRSGTVPLSRYAPGKTPRPHFLEAIKDTAPKPRGASIGIVGLGKMGANLSRRLMENGWRVFGFNKTPDETKELENEGMSGVYSIKELMEKLPSPRIIWLMVPAGKPIDDVLFGPSTSLGIKKNGLVQYVNKGDIVIDGGNSFYKDSVARYKKLKKRGVYFVDVGVSGGPRGAREGASLMIGGDRKIFERLKLLFQDLAIENGYQFFEGAGAGHFVKMVHNGIEYGMMQAIAEGFAVLEKAKYKLDLTRVADVYNHGSVIESRLIGWLQNALEAYGGELKGVSGSVGHTGEGEWTIKVARELKARARVIEEALNFRIKSEKNPSYTGKILSALRNQFGGHSIDLPDSNKKNI